MHRQSGNSTGNATARTIRVPRLISMIIFALVLITGQLTPAAADPGEAENGDRLMDTVALYPRVIRLQHSGAANGRIIAGVVTFADGAGHGAIFQSTDDGRSFDRIGTVSDPGAARGLCCATLYELPQQVGELPAGTLIWSASVGQDAGAERRMTLPVWSSQDHGRTWTYESTIATSPNFGGLWEPEFTVSEDGRLVMFVSDESQQPMHSQTLVLSVSSDVKTWTPLRNVVAADDPELRPGMPVVRRIPGGDYLMSYEICGPGQGCRHMVRRSTDGLDWGTPNDLGRPIRAHGDWHFRHAPTISWYDDGTGNGRLLAVGQMLYNGDGTVAAEGNGSTVFVNGAAPESRWQQAPAPVRITEPYDNYCPNYSSSLLPMPETGELLELATGYDEGGVCTTYFAVGELP